MPSKFEFNVEEGIIMKVVVCSCVPVLTLDVLHIDEDQTYVARLTNLAKSGYFSVVGPILF